MLNALKITASRALYVAYRASTKITAIFFTAIVITVAGGTYSYFAGSETPGHYDERSPSSIAEAEAAAHARSLLPGFDANSPRSFQQMGSPGMPAEYADRASAQENRDTVMPVSIDPAVQANGAQSLTSVSPFGATNQLLGQLPEVDPDATSTATNTASETAAMGAGFNSTATETSTTTTGPTSFLLTGSTTGWTGVCQQATITLVDSSYLSVAATGTTTISLSTSAGGIFNDAACATAVTSLSITAGSSAGYFYFLSDTAGAAIVTTYNASLGTQTATVTVADASADFALGQSALTANTANRGAAAAANTLNIPQGSLRVNGMYFVADSGNHRVLAWSSAPTTAGQAADFVLGQPDLLTVTANTGGVTAQSLSGPTSVSTDGTRLFVTDTDNHRVLIWDTIPTTLRKAADHVLGQADMNSNGANAGGISSSALNTPTCVTSNGTKLFVCDRGNNRVLVWNTIPTTDNATASVVVGQPDDTTVAAGFTAAKLDNPVGAYVSGTQLYVSDFGNNRVLAWSTIPTASGTAATFALGQSDTVSNGANAGGLASGLTTPTSVSVDSQGRLFVSDYGNNRVLVWNQAPSASGVSPSAVLGQPDLTSSAANNGGVGASRMDGPWALEISGSELLVSEFNNHRVLSFTLP